MKKENTLGARISIVIVVIGLLASISAGYFANFPYIYVVLASLIVGLLSHLPLFIERKVKDVLLVGFGILLVTFGIVLANYAGWDLRDTLIDESINNFSLGLATVVVLLGAFGGLNLSLDLGFEKATVKVNNES